MTVYAREMSGFPSPGPWEKISEELRRPNRRQVVVVIAYIGRDAPALMPLKAGDWLVCDASDTAIKQQLTSVEALRAFRRRKVAVFSVSGLHAKVIASSTSAWVGSANASRNSTENLIEASVKVTGVQARRVRQWAESLATDDREISGSDLTRLAGLKKYPFRPGPKAEVIPTTVPASIPSIVFVETSEGLTKQEAAAVAQDNQHARTAAQHGGFAARLGHILITSPTSIRAGDWVVDIRNGHVRRPAYVVRTKRSPYGLIVWLSESTTHTRPSIRALRACIDALGPEFGEVRIKDQNKVRSVLKLYK